MHDPLPTLDIRLPELVFPSASAAPSTHLVETRPVPAIGRLAGEHPDAMTLHTREAWRLFTGRQADALTKTSAIPGARRFAAILRSIWALSAQDNPYADWFLIQTDQRLRELRTQMDRVIQEREAEFERQRRRGLNLSVLASSRPMQVELGFRSPYGYAVAQAVLDFDFLVRMVQTLVLKDLLSDEAGRAAIREFGRAFRAMFQTSISWERGLLNRALTSLGRRDFVAGAEPLARERARAAVALLGEVPRSVFTGDEAPRHSLRRSQLSAEERRLLDEASLADPFPTALESINVESVNAEGLL